ncbi:hypothetical protein [Pseudonocardia humida]|uniref:DUF4386 family protein n=1 Tax=Pseudonocardia humida TaxID=2800819 RepID=A0ABT1A8S8_9PSEU|nr:hypothetical protein [Pseudonocardia humida]MCO1659345.1 hypothetical protein [Pseudonocardia humida]
MSTPSTPLDRYAASALWVLPFYGVLLALSTLTHQPPITDFDAYARYVSTDDFLVSHLVASIGGAALAAVGTAGALVFLGRGRAVRVAAIGTALTLVAHVVMASAFGSAAFAQPGIGRAHLAGAPGMAALNLDTAYGPALVATIGVSTLLFIAGAIVLGTAVARTAPGLRWAGTAYAVALPLFVVAGLALQVLQPVLGLVVALATAVVARRLPRSVPAGTATATEPATAAHR